MSTRSFNQYIKMFYEEHNHWPSNLDQMIGNVYSSSDSVIELHADLILPTVNNIIVTLHPCEANNQNKQHSHDYFELMYVSKGSCTQRIGDVQCNLSEGDFCLLNPFVTHEIDIDSKDTLLFNIVIKEKLFKESFLCMLEGTDFISNFFVTSLFTTFQQKSYLYFPNTQNISSSKHIQALIIELLEKKMGYQKAAENYLALFFTELARVWQNQIDKENYSMMGDNPLTEILAYINKYKREVTLTSVAERFHYHPKYLSSLIKKYTNKNFSEIIQEARLQEVCYYLTNTSLSIMEIANLMGYYDQSYFNRIFKKTYHMSPGQYRETTAENNM